MKYRESTLLYVSNTFGIATWPNKELFVDELMVKHGDVICLLQDVNLEIDEFEPIKILTQFGPRVTFENWLDDDDVTLL